MKFFYVYIVKCSDDSYYIGMTNDVDRRVVEHNSAENTGSYTSNRRPVKLLWNIQLTDFNQAEELEKQIKRWSRKKKEALIKGQWDKLKVLAACKNSSSHENYNAEQEPFSHTERSRSMNEKSSETDATNSAPFDSAQDDCLPPLGHSECSRRVEQEVFSVEEVDISYFDSAQYDLNVTPSTAVLNSWQPFLKSQTSQPYYKDLQAFLHSRKEQGAIIFPPEDEIFKAFELTPLEKIKVVILGQDPYHGAVQAHGLCFSVRKGNRIPPSLRNIFRELHADLGIEIPDSGELTAWAKKGVFLLNTILTVEEKTPAAHKGKGWETFTDSAIEYISTKKDKIVFILWGAYAQKKRSLIDESKHLVLAAPHPAAEVYAGGKAGFFGSRPFSKANAFLDNKVDWSL